MTLEVVKVPVDPELGRLMKRAQARWDRLCPPGTPEREIADRIGERVAAEMLGAPTLGLGLRA